MREQPLLQNGKPQNRSLANVSFLIDVTSSRTHADMCLCACAAGGGHVQFLQGCSPALVLPFPSMLSCGLARSRGLAFVRHVNNCVFSSCSDGREGLLEDISIDTLDRAARLPRFISCLHRCHSCCMLLSCFVYCTCYTRTLAGHTCAIGGTRKTPCSFSASRISASIELTMLVLRIGLQLARGPMLMLSHSPAHTRGRRAPAPAQGLAALPSHSPVAKGRGRGQQPR